MEAACKPVEKLMQAMSGPALYTGIDVSVAPSCGPDAIDTSLVTAYEALLPKFGGAGTLTLSAMITGVLKTLDVLVSSRVHVGLAQRTVERVGTSLLIFLSTRNVATRD
jgi:hypothetical protein